MLILTRRPGESIRIGNQIVITPLGVQGLQVRVGIQAPASVEVHREEVFQRIQAERDGAAPAKPQHIDVRIRQAADQVDPRNLFIAANPAGFSPEDLEFGGTGFADKYANDAYAVFLSGYRAALEASPCEC